MNERELWLLKHDILRIATLLRYAEDQAFEDPNKARKTVDDAVHSLLDLAYVLLADIK